MKRLAAFAFATLVLMLTLWFAPSPRYSATRALANARSTAPPGNIADGMYTIVGEASHRCLEIPSNSCAAVTPLQIFDCDKSEVSNNQKFNVVSDGSGNYTISPVHSDLCLEVPTDKVIDRTAVVQAECVAGKVSQKWSMNQFGVNLAIRDVESNRCLDIMRKGTDNFAPIFLRSCNDGPNQRWRLSKTTINVDQGVLCRESPSHPARTCSGVNAEQKDVALGRTLTKARCDDACRVNKMVSCRWEEAK
jgi:hypothetical protein